MAQCQGEPTKKDDKPTVTYIGTSHAHSLVQNINSNSNNNNTNSFPPQITPQITSLEMEKSCPFKKFVNCHFKDDDIYVDIKLDQMIKIINQSLREPPLSLDFPTTKLKKDWIVVGLVKGLNEKVDGKLNWKLVKCLMNTFKKWAHEMKQDGEKLAIMVKNTVDDAFVAGGAGYNNDDRSSGYNSGGGGGGGRPRFKSNTIFRRGSGGGDGVYKIIITGLSSNITAQDLTDWIEREKMSVTVTAVYNRHGLNEGVIEFEEKADWDYAISNLDNTKLDGQYVRVYDEREYNRRKLKEYNIPPKYQGRDRNERRSRSRSKGRNNYSSGYNNDDRSSGYNNRSGGCEKYGNNNNNNYKRDDNRRRRGGGGAGRSGSKHRSRSRDRGGRDKFDNNRGCGDRNDRHDRYDRYDTFNNKENVSPSGSGRDKYRSGGRDKIGSRDRRDRFNGRDRDNYSGRSSRRW